MICKYPVIFSGMVETIPGMEEKYWVIYRCNMSLPIESFDHRKQLGYDVCKFRLTADRGLVSNEVNSLCFQNHGHE